MNPRLVLACAAFVVGAFSSVVLMWGAWKIALGFLLAAEVACVLYVTDKADATSSPGRVLALLIMVIALAIIVSLSL